MCAHVYQEMIVVYSHFLPLFLIPLTPAGGRKEQCVYLLLESVS